MQSLPSFLQAHNTPSDIAAILKEAEARAERIRKLVKILEVMQPAAGAQTATGITMDLLVELLLRMKPKKAAGILN